MLVDTIYSPERPIVELSNGKLVANFSSPHPFTFTDGNILPAKSKIESERLKVNFHEDTDTNGDVRLSLAYLMRLVMKSFIGCVYMQKIKSM